MCRDWFPIQIFHCSLLQAAGAAFFAGFRLPRRFAPRNDEGDISLLAMTSISLRSCNDENLTSPLAVMSGELWLPSITSGEIEATHITRIESLAFSTCLFIALEARAGVEPAYTALQAAA